jgi:hypothetical protein
MPLETWRWADPGEIFHLAPLGWGWAEDFTNWVPLLRWKVVTKAVTIRVDDPGIPWPLITAAIWLVPDGPQ